MNSSFIQNKIVNNKFCQYTNEELNLTVNRILPKKISLTEQSPVGQIPLYKQLITSTSELIKTRLIILTVSERMNNNEHIFLDIPSKETRNTAPTRKNPL